MKRPHTSGSTCRGRFFNESNLTLIRPFIGTFSLFSSYRLKVRISEHSKNDVLKEDVKMLCPHCQHEQQLQSLCDHCGKPMQVENHDLSSHEDHEMSSSEGYFRYLIGALQLSKHAPKLSFSLFNFGIYFVIALLLAHIKLIAITLDSSMQMTSATVTFSIILMITYMLPMVLTSLITFIITFFSEDHIPFNKMMTAIGHYYAIPAVLSVSAFLLSLLSLGQIGGALMSLASFFAILIIPYLTCATLLRQYTFKTRPVTLYIIIGLLQIVCYIVGSILLLMLFINFFLDLVFDFFDLFNSLRQMFSLNSN